MNIAASEYPFRLEGSYFSLWKASITNPFSSSSLCCRLVELAPQYYLGNLPSSDGKELLMELRQSLEPHSYQQGVGVSDEHSRTHRDTDGTAEAHNQSSTELCVVQWDERRDHSCHLLVWPDVWYFEWISLWTLIWGFIVLMWFQMDLYWKTLMYSIVNLSYMQWLWKIFKPLHFLLVVQCVGS